MTLTFKAVAEQLRPLALELATQSDDGAPRDVLVVKAMICLIMGMADQMTSDERLEFAEHVAYHLWPLYEQLLLSETKEPNGDLTA